ncbi:hypothetical protein [Xanthomonas prunicola]|uniref:Uncharacterized protein n=1 Tax=Xanthomonas prunicola TaxID=2053930 RepID=A0A9Q9IYZ4_9XANT|nr:hypothetical protein [Xanthomonas prunicola]UXA49615.1 hypothetical protein M0D44_03325 [Xanthomonas prunicola]UXA52692.1 hypothetical protein M0D45_18950 [Xanthomonas prunicola]UXA57911.1 hypothetical protein M0D47_03310 [Xanthomonas prunicola]UXA60063.1 hypothetical protein M0D48_13605 [Xanthomonas prunicola]UXA66125.1 hypothetical protein M0D43_03530 [Xanthomonas prunicola]
MSRARDLHGAAGSTAAHLADSGLHFLPSAFAMRARALRVTRVGDARRLAIAGTQEH